jgi:hypothetical protein
MSVTRTNVNKQTINHDAAVAISQHPISRIKIPSDIVFFSICTVYIQKDFRNSRLCNLILQQENNQPHWLATTTEMKCTEPNVQRPTTRRINNINKEHNKN